MQTGAVLLHVPSAMQTLRMDPLLGSKPLLQAYTAVELTAYGGVVVTRPFSGSSNSGHMMTGNVGGKELNHGKRNTKKSSTWESNVLELMVQGEKWITGASYNGHSG